MGCLSKRPVGRAGPFYRRHPGCSEPRRRTSPRSTPMPSTRPVWQDVPDELRVPVRRPRVGRRVRGRGRDRRPVGGLPLARAGRKVVVLEARSVGSGMTSHTTAHLACVLDDRFASVIKVRGEENARLGAEAHRAAIDFIEETARREQIDCGFTAARRLPRRRVGEGPRHAGRGVRVRPQARHRLRAADGGPRRVPRRQVPALPQSGPVRADGVPDRAGEGDRPARRDGRHRRPRRVGRGRHARAR